MARDGMHPGAMNQRASRSREILACLGDASRFRLVLSLIERQGCVTELARRVRLSQSCTTRHLQFLEREGIVRGLREGKRVVFRLEAGQPRVRELLAWVMASAPGPHRFDVSGADVHAEVSLPGGLAGGLTPPRSATRPRSRSRGRQVLRQAIPVSTAAADVIAHAGPPAGLAAEESVSREATIADTSPSTASETQAPDGADSRAQRQDLEDWLL